MNFLEIAKFCLTVILFAIGLMGAGWALIRLFTSKYHSKLNQIRRDAMNEHFHLKNYRMLLTPFTISYEEMEDEILDFNLKYKDQIDSETLTQFTGELYDTLQKRRGDIKRHKQLN